MAHSPRATSGPFTAPLRALLPPALGSVGVPLRVPRTCVHSAWPALRLAFFPYVASYDTLHVLSLCSTPCLGELSKRQLSYMMVFEVIPADLMQSHRPLLLPCFCYMGGVAWGGCSPASVAILLVALCAFSRDHAVWRPGIPATSRSSAWIRKECWVTASRHLLRNSGLKSKGFTEGPSPSCRCCVPLGPEVHTIGLALAGHLCSRSLRLMVTQDVHTWAPRADCGAQTVDTRQARGLGVTRASREARAGQGARRGGAGDRLAPWHAARPRP